MATVLAFKPSLNLVEKVCGHCGIVFAVPQAFNEDRLRDHSKSWWCPNGHDRHYIGETAAEGLQKQLAEKERQLAYERERASTNFAAREKAERKAKKLEKRISGGACPCCNRSFVALSRHMKTKHPEFVAEARS